MNDSLMQTYCGSTVGAGFERFPSALVLDIEPQIRYFHEETAKMRDYEWCIDEILREILHYIEDRTRAEYGLVALREDILLYFGVDAHILAPAATCLGEEIYRQLSYLGAYTTDGWLPYEFGTDWVDHYNPVLVRRTALNLSSCDYSRLLARL